MPPNYDELKTKIINKDYLFTAHASNRAVERNITSKEVEDAIINGSVIEDYPDDKYSPSCLILGKTSANRILHIQLSYPPNIKIITVYEPSSLEWSDDFKTRKSE